jgi:phosphoserine aminotransferase
MKQLFFTPGPAELYFTVETHIKNALNEHVPSISHRSKAFEGIYREAVQNLKDLLELPDNYHIFFTGSATEIWERILENCVESQSYHYVNGAFSKRFYETALQLKKAPLHQQAADGSCSSVNTGDIPDTAELIAFTQNETSTGAAQPLSDIYAVREAFPDKLIAVDAVSSLPYIDIDYHKVDTVFFSVQKGFGLPAGLGVWLVNDRCLEKADQLAAKGLNIGTYHSLPSLLVKAQKNQTPGTPNVLGIYLLAKVTGDMLKKGIGRIRQESEYKAAVLYNLIEHHARFRPFVKEAKYRSGTVIVAETEALSSEIIQKLLERNIVIGAGYGTYKNQHIRIANFPTHSREKVEMLADYLQAM